MCKKRVKITLHSNIVTLQTKNKNNAFKAEVAFTKLKIYLITVTLQLMFTYKYTYFVGLKFYISHIYCPTTNISAKCTF